MNSSEFNLAIGNCIRDRNPVALRDLFLRERDLLLSTRMIDGTRAIDYTLESILNHVEDDFIAMEFCSLLLDFGADVNSSSFIQSKVGPIMYAARRSLTLVRLFHSRGGIINHELHGQLTSWPLLNAITANRIEIVHYLIENGAVVNFVNSHGLSPMDYALRDPKLIEIANVLHHRGAKVGAELTTHGDSIINHISNVSANRTCLIDHLREWFLDVNVLSCHGIPLQEEGSRLLTVLNPDDGMIGIVTDGMSLTKSPTISSYSDSIMLAELIIFIPPNWPLSSDALEHGCNFWPVECLLNISRWPIQNQTSFRKANIITNGNPPRPLGDNSEFCGVLVFHDNNEWSTFIRGDGETVFLLTAMPLYLSECNSEQLRGLPLFIDKLNTYPYGPVLWPGRPPVV